jgi:hypothetical protein
MKQSPSTLVKNVVVALVFGLAAIATWAVTQSDAPQIEAPSRLASNG